MKKRKISMAVCALATFICTAATGMPHWIANAKYDPEDYFLFPEEVKKTAYLGEKTELARISPTSKSAENYSFTVVYTADASVIKTEGYAFLPERAGEYKCIYSYIEKGEKREYSYLIDVTIKDSPVFSGEPIYPNAFVSGCTYEIDYITAAEYLGGQKADIEVSVSATCEGTPLTITNGVICPVATAENAAVKIVYTATGKNASEKIEKMIPVVEVYGENNEVDFTEIFSHVGTQSEAMTDCVQYTTYTDTSLPFANLLSASDTALQFGFGENAGAQKLTLDIVSYADPSVAVSLTFDKGIQAQGSGQILLNGGSAKPYNFTKNQIFEVKIDSKNNRLTDGSGQVLFEIDKDIHGGVFDGFAGNLIKITLRVEGVYDKCDVKVYQVNTQVLSSERTEMVRPLYYYNYFLNEATIGQKVTVDNIIALDVVDPNATITTKVYFGRQELSTTATEQGGVSFTPEVAGEYRFEFVVADRSGNEKTYREFVSVYDETKPTLSLSAGLAQKVALNGTLVIPAATATDNGGEEGITMRITVVYPSGQARTIALSTGGSLEETTFEPTQVGTYRIYYYAGDEYNNYVLNEYQVVCEG